MNRKLKPLDHLSATAIEGFIKNCELQAAYKRCVIPSIVPPEPEAIAYGVAMHHLLEYAGKMFWKKVQTTGKPLLQDDYLGLPSYARNFILGLFSNKHSSRGTSFPPKPIQWLAEFDFKRGLLTAHEYAQRKQQRIGYYVGMAGLTIEAYRQQFMMNPLPFKNIHFEFGFTGKNFYIKDGKGWGFRLYGSLDVVEEFLAPNEHGKPIEKYNVIDNKSGTIVRDWQKRIKGLEDIQMTVYSYVMETLWGYPPAGIYIQPLDISRKDLDRDGPETLRKKRILIPAREKESYIDELVDVSKDIVDLTHMIAQRSHHTRKEIMSWKPRTIHAERAGFQESIQAGRFTPRIGPWCKNCSFYDICRQDNPADWEKHAHFLEGEPQVPDLPVVEEDPQLALFTQVPKKVQRKGKFKTAQFREHGIFKVQEITAYVKQMNNLIWAAQKDVVCPCREAGRVQARLFLPFVLEYFTEREEHKLQIKEARKRLENMNLAKSLYDLEQEKGKKKKSPMLKESITVEQVLASCTFPGCPFTKEVEDEAWYGGTE